MFLSIFQLHMGAGDPCNFGVRLLSIFEIVASMDFCLVACQECEKRKIESRNAAATVSVQVNENPVARPLAKWV